MGQYSRYNQVVKRVRDGGKMEILALGGSITAGGYFQEFVRSLREKNNLTVTVNNHGHGATEITCKSILLDCNVIYCVVFYCIIFYFTVLYDIVFYDIFVLHDIILSCIV